MSSDNYSIKLSGGYLIVTVKKNEKNLKQSVKKLLEQWYQNQAERRLKQKTERLAKIVGVIPKSITVKNYKSRWGSCNTKGELTFNWRIILAPHYIVDYVVIHELCHLLEHNHSYKYWRHVENHVPNWKDCKSWLNNKSSLLYV